MLTIDYTPKVIDNVDHAERLTWRDLTANTLFWDGKWESDASRLFAVGLDEAEVWHFGAKRIHHLSIRGLLSISEAVRPKQGKGEEAFCILRQRHSWSELSVTKETFKRILEIRNVLPQFAQFVQGFGVKFSEDEKVRTGCLTPVFSHEGIPGAFHYVACYNIQYIAKYDQPSKNPWCLRQTCVYQQFDSASMSSFWILIQPPKVMLDALQAVLEARSQHSNPLQNHPLTVHNIFLEVLLCDWEDYIQDLRAEISDIDDKACFSRMDAQSQHDYTVTFKDTQRLQLIRQRLFRAQSVLDSQMAIIERCKSLATRLAEITGPSSSSHAISSNFETYASQIHIYRKNIERILQYSWGTVEILSKILEFRNDENVLQTNRALKDNLDVLSRMAVQEGQIAEQGQEDSRLLKALNVIAIIYLPASLIATIFSSNLIDIQSKRSGAGNHFVVADQFWIYVLITAALTVLTFACSLLLSRQWSRRTKP